MKMHALVSAVLVAFAGTALAQAPAPSQTIQQAPVKGSVKADAVKMDKSLKADKAAVKMDQGAIKSADHKAGIKSGHKAEMAADKAKLKVDQHKAPGELKAGAAKQAIQK